MMTVAELIEALQKYPPDTRVVAGAMECWGDPCLVLRGVHTAEWLDAEADDPDYETFAAVTIGGDDELYDDAGPT